MRPPPTRKGTNSKKFVTLSIVAALLLACQSAWSASRSWQLRIEEGYSMGTFTLDLAAEFTSDIDISGDLAHYTLPSFTFLDTVDHVGPERVHDYISFFSTLTGLVYRDDYGGGEYYENRVNESALQIGTLYAPLDLEGDRFDVVINEIFNFDEIHNYCVAYEEVFDVETGDYLGDGPCSYYNQDAYYNVDSGYWYYGTLSLVADTSTVPLPPGAVLSAPLLGVWGVRVMRTAGGSRR